MTEPTVSIRGGTKTVAEPAFAIREGAVYTYLSIFPKGCQGCRYRVLKVDVLDVPSYAHKVLVECLEGPDRGLFFCTSPANFSMRYQPVEDAAP